MERKKSPWSTISLFDGLSLETQTSMNSCTALALNAEACTNNRTFQTIEQENLTRKFY